MNQLTPTGDEAIYLTPYDISWPGRFEQERQLLLDVLKPWLIGPIEHIGSTAVAGLDAKPVIDIMAGIGSLETARAAIDALAPYGYCYSPYRQELEIWFCKPSPAHRTHHLHLIPFESQQWCETLALRNYSREHMDARAEYL